MKPIAALLTLADARLPTGGHAHSGGVEQAITTGVVSDLGGLAEFLDRRVHTVGPVAAALAAAAAACHAARSAQELAELDEEADARTPSPAMRAASRALGRGLARLGKRAWPHTAWGELPDSPHHSIALGVAAAAAGLDPPAAAQVAAYLTVSGAATAAQRLLSLDPLAVAAVTAGLSPAVDEVADRACQHSAEPWSELSGLSGLTALSDPWFDLLAETHSSREDRLFAS